jgi:hypothetical protein
MFVSSYNTYINTSSSQKTQREKADLSTESKSSYSEKVLPQTSSTLVANTSLPVNYISNYKVLSNQQRLQDNNTQTQEKTKFTKINANQSAKEAYTDNTKIFSFLIQPKATLNQTPRVDKKMSPDAQEAQEKNLRYTMVNTYIANDNYYKITA